MKRFRRRSTSSRLTALVSIDYFSPANVHTSGRFPAHQDVQFEPEAMLSRSPDCWLPILAGDLAGKELGACGEAAVEGRSCRGGRSTSRSPVSSPAAQGPFTLIGQARLALLAAFRRQLPRPGPRTRPRPLRPRCCCIPWAANSHSY